MGRKIQQMFVRFFAAGSGSGKHGFLSGAKNVTISSAHVKGTGSGDEHFIGRPMKINQYLL
jgi:hypothetical protein